MILEKFQKMIMGEKEYDEILERAKLDKAMEDIPKRAVINGLLYDTSKAKNILTTYNWIDSSSLRKKLYITPNGRFFTECQSIIEPKTEDEVKQILSRYPDKYRELFGEVEDA